MGSQITTTPVKVYTGTTTKSKASGGEQAITGIGFKPKAVWIVGGEVASANEYSLGVSMVTTDGCLYRDASGTWQDGAGSCVVNLETPGNSFGGEINSFDEDGFTIDWTKTGTPTGTVTMHFLAIG